MKLRISGNSIRLRLRRSEVDRLADGGDVEESIRFAPGGDDRLSYLIRTESFQPEIQASYADSQIVIGVPQKMADEWIGSETVGIAGKVPIGNGEFLDVLIEKDFPCRRSETAEDPEDLFGELRNKAEC